MDHIPKVGVLSRSGSGSGSEPSSPARERPSLASRLPNLRLPSRRFTKQSSDPGSPGTPKKSMGAAGKPEDHKVAVVRVPHEDEMCTGRWGRRSILLMAGFVVLTCTGLIVGLTLVLMFSSEGGVVTSRVGCYANWPNPCYQTDG